MECMVDRAATKVCMRVTDGRLGQDAMTSAVYTYYEGLSVRGLGGKERNARCQGVVFVESERNS